MFGFGKRKKAKEEARRQAEQAAAEPIETPGGTEEQESSEPAAPAEATAQVEPAETPVAQSIAEPAQESAPAVEAESAEAPIVESIPEPAQQPAPAEDQPKKPGIFARLKNSLKKTSQSFSEGIGDLVLGKRKIDDELLEELETQLLVADVGIEATTTIINDLTQRVSRSELKDAEALLQALREDMAALLQPVEQPLLIDNSAHQPYVILVIGINGAGKTTTIGKLAKRLQNEGKSVMLAAGDTFRAAAVEQLQVWGERNEIPVIAQHSGADSASVIFDAIEAARARNVDVVIADTAGRLHTQSNLMEELKKVKRVMGKLDESAPHETLLVLDSGTGQNALNQAEQFGAAIGVSGLALTKLDGTAKGGIIFAIARKMGIPIRFIGVGETIDDLRTFHAQEFVDALFQLDTTTREQD